MANQLTSEDIKKKNYRIVSYVIDVAAFKLFQHHVIGAVIPTLCFVHDLLMDTLSWKVTLHLAGKARQWQTL